MDNASLYEFLANHRYGVVSSLGNDGAPQSALVGIAVTPALEIIFDTLKLSRKYSNLLEYPACSFVIGWENEQTVQFEGIAEKLWGLELERLQAVYFSVWPDGQMRASWPSIAYFVVRPTWVRYSDYNQQPPFAAEFRFPMPS